MLLEMKRILSKTALAAIMMFFGCGCQIAQEQDFEPTMLGYELTNDFARNVLSKYNRLFVLQHFNEWLSEQNAEAREEIHDKWFYSSRIVERKTDEWHIITPYEEMVILTGGKMFDQDDTQWRYYYADGIYDESDLPSFTRTGSGEDEGYLLYVPSCGGEQAFELALTLSEYDSIDGGNHTKVLRITAEGDGTAEQPWYCSGIGDDPILFTILEPLVYDYGTHSFTSGRIRFDLTVDGTARRPEVEFDKNNGFTVCDGPDNRYSQHYNINLYNNYYFYE